MPNKNQSATRYSAVSEINTENVKNLKVAWSFSTRVLRGHEGEPLVVGNTMYVHTPFPNIVYALDLSKEGAPVKWKCAPNQDPTVIPIACCDTVNRGVTYDNGKIFLNQLDTHTVALDAETGKSSGRSSRATYKQGQTMTSAPMVVKDKVISESPAASSASAASSPPTTSTPASRSGPDEDIKHRPEADVGFRRVSRNVEGRRVERWRRHHVGLVPLRPRARPLLLRHRQPRLLESRSAARATTNGR